jgi:hypothetical protein
MNDENNSRLEDQDKPGPKHPSVHYEPNDVPVGRVLSALAAVGVMIVIAAVVSWILFRWFPNVHEQTGFVVPQLRQSIERMLPPEPRLQPSPGHPFSPQDELRQMERENEAKLNSYEWVDQKSGIARIPITEAMRLFAEQGLTAKVPPGPPPPHVHMPGMEHGEHDMEHSMPGMEHGMEHHE